MADMARAGEIRYEVHYLPIFPATGPAIFAVQCAGEQGYWWAMHGRILEDQTRGIRAVQTLDDLDALLARYAEELGLDMAAYRQCLASEEKVQGYIDRVNDQIAAAQDLGQAASRALFEPVAHRRLPGCWPIPRTAILPDRSGGPARGTRLGGPGSESCPGRV